MYVCMYVYMELYTRTHSSSHPCVDPFIRPSCLPSIHPPIHPSIHRIFIYPFFDIYTRVNEIEFTPMSLCNLTCMCTYVYVHAYTDQYA